MPKNNIQETSPQEVVEKKPEKYIIEECLPACKELWKKNIYTFMTSNHNDTEGCWIEIITENLSEENINIFMQLEDDNIIKRSDKEGTIKFISREKGKKGQNILLEAAKQFKMQDVPFYQAYITPQSFLMNHCYCYDIIPNPNYKKMKEPWEKNLPLNELDDYVLKYEKWKSSPNSKKHIRVFNPDKAIKPIEELAKEQGRIYSKEEGRIYLSKFHYKKHLEYEKYLNNSQQKHHRR